MIGSKMWLRFLLAFLLPLAVVGCAAIEPFIECVFRCDSMMVFYDDAGGFLGLQEVHDELPYMAGITEGAVIAWEPCDWDNEKLWYQKRIGLGVPLDLCVTAPDGRVICPPWVARGENNDDGDPDS